MSGPRVLVVDDSAFARKVLREVLQRARIEVVGSARDGLEALERIAELRPDVVALDLVMPDLDGLGVLRALAAMPAPPRVLVVSASGAESELVLEALALGAVDFVHKPTSIATDRLYELGAELVHKVRAAASARAPAAAPAPVPAPRDPALPPAGDAIELVVVGTSTGGPPALGTLLAALPADLPALALVLHIPAEYTPALARRLDAGSAVEVVEAYDGIALRPGRAVLARGGLHLVVERAGDGLVGRLADAPQTLHRPSVDVLFESAARACGAATLGVVLTGMGDDGLLGARALRAAGGHVVVEAESSCVVYGMPRAVAEAGLADVQLPLERVAREIVRRTRS